MAAPPTFTFDTVACLTAALENNGVTLGLRHFEAMARLDEERTASSFEHQFRKVKARARELAKVLGDGSAGTASRKTAKPSSLKSPSSGCKSAEPGKKRGKTKGSGKAGAVKEETAGDVEELDDGDKGPNKKIKLEEGVNVDISECTSVDKELEQLWDYHNSEASGDC